MSDALSVFNIDEQDEDSLLSKEDRAHILEQRSDFTYDEVVDFSTPIAIRGTRRIMQESKDLKRGLTLDEFIAKTHEVDENFNIIRITSIAQVQLRYVNNEMIVFALAADPETLYYFETPRAIQNPLAFKRFSALLEIPFAFTKKSPFILNKVNFDYYLRHATLLGKKRPLDIIFSRVADSLSFASEEEGIEPTSIFAHQVYNFLEAEGRGDSISTETPPIASRIPFVSDIAAGFRDLIKKTAPEIDPILQSYSVGYGSQKGEHFLRVLFDSPATEFELKGEKYQLAANIETDFSGFSPDFGDVNVSFLLFREICTNGLMAAWTMEDKRTFRETFVIESLEQAGFTVNDTDDLAVDIRRTAEARFELIFSEGGIRLSIAQANVGMADTSELTLGLDFFLKSATLQKKRMEALQEDFAHVGEEEFVRVVTSLQKEFKLSPELVKLFLIEFISGEISGKQVFKTPLSVANFLTFLARAYDVSLMTHVERRAGYFALAMQDAFLKQVSEVSLSQSIRAKIKPEMIPGV